MPFVLKHKITSQIATDTLINLYDLPYFGTKYWEQLDAAELEYTAFLQSQGLNDFDLWDIHEIEESQMKIYNVKLKNDPGLRLFLNEDHKPIVKPADML
jgi:hypothetical protein